MVKSLPAKAGDAGDAHSIPGSGRSPGVGTGNPLQYACLENPMDREAWWANSSQSCKELDMSEHTCTHTYGARMLHSWVLRTKMGAQHPDGGSLYKLLFSRGVLISSRGILILCGLRSLCKTSNFKFLNGYFEAEYHVMTWLLGAQ